MAIDSKDYASQQLLTGRFDSASSAADVTETLPWTPSCFICFVDVGGTNPNMLVYTTALATETMLTTGSTGVITTPANTSGIVVSGTSVTIVAGAQVNSGKNFWIAIK
jgi:hypothetical protein